jgi:hypothetical protein
LRRYAHEAERLSQNVVPKRVKLLMAAPVNA